MAARGAVALSERLKVPGEMLKTNLAAISVDEVVDAVAVGDQQAIEVAE
jgi:hypothetical protein